MLPKVVRIKLQTILTTDVNNFFNIGKFNILPSNMVCNIITRTPYPLENLI